MSWDDSDSEPRGDELQRRLERDLSEYAEHELLAHLNTFEVGTVLKIDGQIYHLQDSGGAHVWRRVKSLAWWKHHQLADYLNRQGVRICDITRFIPEAS